MTDITNLIKEREIFRKIRDLIFTGRKENNISWEEGRKIKDQNNISEADYQVFLNFNKNYDNNYKKIKEYEENQKIKIIEKPQEIKEIKLVEKTIQKPIEKTIENIIPNINFSKNIMSEYYGPNYLEPTQQGISKYIGRPRIPAKGSTPQQVKDFHDASQKWKTDFWQHPIVSTSADYLNSLQVFSEIDDNFTYDGKYFHVGNFPEAINKNQVKSANWRLKGLMAYADNPRTFYDLKYNLTAIKFLYALNRANKYIGMLKKLGNRDVNGYYNVQTEQQTQKFENEQHNVIASLTSERIPNISAAAIQAGIDRSNQDRINYAGVESLIEAGVGYRDNNAAKLEAKSKALNYVDVSSYQNDMARNARENKRATMDYFYEVFSRGDKFGNIRKDGKMLNLRKVPGVDVKLRPTNYYGKNAQSSGATKRYERAYIKETEEQQKLQKAFLEKQIKEYFEANKGDLDYNDFASRVRTHLKDYYTQEAINKLLKEQYGFKKLEKRAQTGPFSMDEEYYENPNPQFVSANNGPPQSTTSNRRRR